MYERKNQSALTGNEWSVLVNAMQKLKRRRREKTWQQFVDEHAADPMSYHSMGGTMQRMFLPWHRQFVLDFERSLQGYAEEIALPYWDWPNEARIPDPLAKVIGGWMKVTRRTRLARNINNRLWPAQEDVDELMAISDFDEFSFALENGTHANVHVVVGGAFGAMSMVARSPKDPLFFLHHCMVDKIWADWQAVHGVYDWFDADETLPAPYEDVRVQDLMNVEDLGFTYAGARQVSVSRRQARNQRQDAREDFRDTKQDARETKRNTVKTSREAKKDVIADAKKNLTGRAKREAKREARREHRDTKKDARKQKRTTKKEARQEKRVKRKTTRQQRKLTKKRS